MIVGIYIRVSTEEQAKEGYPHSFACAKLNMGTGSLEVQRESSLDFFEIRTGRTMYLEAFAKREGFEILVL